MITSMTDPPVHPEIEIDEGVRSWHRSCPCCLSEAYPNVRTILDAERDETGTSGDDRMAPSFRASKEQGIAK